MTDGRGATAVIAELVREWGRYYVISYSAGQYHAERRDNGARVHQADPEQLLKAIDEDFRGRPVMLR